MQIFQKGRIGSTLCTLRKLWKAVVRLVRFLALWWPFHSGHDRFTRLAGGNDLSRTPCVLDGASSPIIKQSTIDRFFGDRTLDFFAETRGAFYAAACLRLLVISWKAQMPSTMAIPIRSVTAPGSIRSSPPAILAMRSGQFMWSKA